MDLSKLREKMQNHHDAVNIGPMRWGDENQVYTGGCFYAVQNCIASTAVKMPMFTVFHGDGLRLSPKALSDRPTYYKELRESKFAFNKYIGTDRSLAWVNFLLSEESPWRALHPWIINKDDPEEINRSGFIYKREGIPRKLSYNFIMATRYLWECPLNATLFNLFVEEAKMRPAAALFLSMFFVLKDKATLEGPYSPIYPWSCLEGGSFNTAGRFVLGRPATLDSQEQCSPNVFPLWQTDVKDIDYMARLQELSKKDLSIFDIVAELEKSIHEQTGEKYSAFVA